VVTIAVVGGASLLLVLATGGSFRQLLRLPIRSIWLVVVALAIQILLALVDIPSDRFDDLGFGLVMASYAFLLAFCFVNLRISMMWVIALGIGLNALVIGLNQGMPTRDREVTTRSGRTIEEPIERTVKHRPESDDDLLPFLGDRIEVPEPVDEVVSLGDLVIALGVVLLCYAGSRVRHPARTRAERMALIAERLRRREHAESETARAEPARAEPAHAEARHAEPARAEPAHAEARPAEPAQAETETPEPQLELQLGVPALAPPAGDDHALSHDSPDDTLGVELKEVYARLAADENTAELPLVHDDDDEPREV
jgi:Family of unknown function (DUF5317)